MWRYYTKVVEQQVAAQRIMIVEDEPVVAMELQQTLNQAGYRVPFTASSGLEALEGLTKDQFDLVLMDIHLEGDMDGVETAARIRERLRIPVVFLTAYSDDEIIDRAVRTESYGFLVKPYNARELKATIDLALYKSKQDRRRVGFSKHYAMMFDAIDAAVLSTDEKGRITYINPKATDLLGLRSTAEILESRIQSAIRFQHASSGDSFIYPLIETVVEGETLESAAIDLVVGNEAKPVYLSVAPLRNDLGTITGTLAIIREGTALESLDDDGNQRDTPHKEMYREVQRIVDMQRAMLPENGSYVGTVACRWLFDPTPFGSGDMFNLFEIDPEHVGFFIFDVMGHGVAAAVFAVALNNLLVSGIAATGFGRHPDISGPASSVPKPGLVLERLNRMFADSDGDKPFFSAIFGVIDQRSGTCTLARGGHPRPVMTSRGGIPQVIDTEGMAIGVWGSAAYTEAKFTLNPGDRIFLYTDGFSEALSRDDPGTRDQLIQGALRGSEEQPLRDVVMDLGNMMNRRRAREAEPVEDDAALLVLEFTGKYGS